MSSGSSEPCRNCVAVNGVCVREWRVMERCPDGVDCAKLDGFRIVMTHVCPICGRDTSRIGRAERVAAATAYAKRLRK